jgi:uncharacterized protein YlxP (DUF503 family)
VTVGILVVELYIPQSGSLKGKRQVIKGLKERVKNRFNVSVAEVGELDLWQKAVLGIVAVANEKGFVNEVMDRVVNFIASHPEVQIVRSDLQMV